MGVKEMAEVEKIEESLEKIEKQFHKHGLWRRPEGRPPEVRILNNWDDKEREIAKILNRIFYVRSLPACTHMFGEARDSATFAFTHDCKTTRDKIEFVRVQLNQLISDLAMLPKLDRTSMIRIEN
jgi:hypothetical protein